jgi:hypothetical protein
MQIEPYTISARTRFYQINKYQFVEGKTALYFNQNIVKLDIDPFPNYQLHEIRRLTRKSFLVLSDRECLVKNIRILANDSLEGFSYKLIFTAESHHRFRWSLFLPQFIFLFFLIGAFTVAVILIWRLLFGLDPLEPWARIIVWFLTTTLLTCLFYFLCMTPFHFLSRFGLSWSRVIITNLVITIVLLAAFFRKIDFPAFCGCSGVSLFPL